MIHRLSAVAWVELVGWLRHPSVYVIFAGLSALVCLSVALGARDLEARRESHRRQLADLAAEQVRPRLPLLGWTSEPVLRAIRPPELGSLVARADDGTVAPYFDFGPAGSVWARGVPTDAAQSQDGTLLDLESIVRVVGGFLAILMGVESIGAARDKGLLKAWTILGTSSTVACAGKLLGCWLAAAILAAILFGVAAFASAVSLRADTWACLVILARCLVPTVLYLATFTSFGALFALTLRPTSSAVTVAVAFWFATSMVWPQAVTFGARALAPTDGRVAMERQRDLAFAAEIRAGENALGDTVVAKIGQKPGPETAAAIREQARELNDVWLDHAKAAREAARTIERQWNSARERQSRIETRGGFLGPGAPLRRAMAALAGTAGLTERWIRLIEKHQDVLNGRLFDDRPQVTTRVPAQQSRQLEPFVRRPGPRWRDLPVAPTSDDARPDPWEESASALLALACYFAVTVAGTTFAAKRLTFYPAS